MGHRTIERIRERDMQALDRLPGQPVAYEPTHRRRLTESRDGESDQKGGDGLQATEHRFLS
jgi:hypothetical protein